MFFASFYNKIAPHIGAVKVLSICGFLCNHKLKSSLRCSCFLYNKFLFWLLIYVKVLEAVFERTSFSLCVNQLTTLTTSGVVTMRISVYQLTFYARKHFQRLVLPTNQ